MNDNLKQLLKGAGYSDDVIAKSEEKDFNVHEAVLSIEEANKSRFKQLFENGSYKEEIEKARDGYWFGDIRTQLKRFGIKSEELKDDMKLKDMFALLRDKTKTETEAAVGKAGEEALKLQNENLEWKNKYTELTEQTENKINEVVKDYENKDVGRQVNFKLKNFYASMPEEQIIGQKRSEGIFLATKSMVDNQFDWSIDEAGEPVPFQKGKQVRPTASINGKETILNGYDVWKMTMDAAGFIIKSNGSGSGGKQQQTTTTTTTQSGTKSARVIELERIQQEQKQANG